MALLTVPAITRGQSATISLDKTALFSLTPVLSDAYFSVQANVREVLVEFNSDPGNQKEILSFDVSEALPTASFLVSDQARSVFLLERVILVDFDDGTLVLERTDLPSGLDITLA